LVDDHWQILLNNLSGTNPKNISLPDINDYNPSWSPSGRYIAFDRRSKNGAVICVYDQREESLDILTNGSEFDASNPRWTPDGEQIVFTYHEIGQPHMTYIMEKNGTGLRRLFNYQADIFFDPEGGYFIYSPVDTYTPKDNCVYRTTMKRSMEELLLDLAPVGKEYTRLTDYNPLNDELLVLLAPQPRTTSIIATYNLVTQTWDTLSVADSGWVYLRPVYSRDYAQVAWVQRHYESSISEICLLEGGIKKTLVQVSAEDEWIDSHSLAFSPEDRYLVYTKNINQPGQMVWWKSFLYVVRIEDQETVLIDEGEDPHWNPSFTN